MPSWANDGGGAGHARVTDRHFMRAAIAASQRCQGTTWPNPSVGCVIVADGRIIGQGTTAPGGRPHAETQALAMAGGAARGATAYVTLEPCAHHGQTPPCAEALIAAGIARVVIGCGDPYAQVNGAGVAKLRAAGIAVSEGVEHQAAAASLAPFLTRVRFGRPLITLKLAATLDGRIATAGGESQWITGDAARAQVHAERGRHDAVMVGGATARADNPDLTCRLPGFAPRPTVRIVWDSFARLPLTHRLVSTAQTTPTWLLHSAAAPAAALAALQSAGVRLFAIPGEPGALNPAAGLRALGDGGLTSVFVEGGGRLAASLLAADLVDRLVWFSAPVVLGADGLPGIGPLGVATLATMPRFRRLAISPVGADLMAVFERADPA